MGTADILATRRHSPVKRVKMGEVITDITQVTPEWLTETLRSAGVLARGRVTSVETDISRPFGSVISHIKLRYSDDMAAPSRLFLKFADQESHAWFPERGRREVEFFRAIPVADFARLPLPRYYAVAHSVDGFHLLLDDLSETHVIVPHPLPPHQAQCEQVIEALARLHAYWWDGEDRLNVMQSGGDISLSGGAEHLLPAFMEFLGDRLWAERRTIFEKVVANSDMLTMRLTTGKHRTLIHGDAHAWNFLYPRDFLGRACLIDWEAWSVDVGVYDLAYFITLFWFPAHRARSEHRLVERYHQRLCEYGVVAYSWEDCWRDYRHSIIRLLFMPVFWWHENRESDFWPELWWPRLERILCAFEDLHCEELLS